MLYDVNNYTNGCWINDYSGWWLEHFGVSAIPVFMAYGLNYSTSYPEWNFDFSGRYQWDNIDNNHCTEDSYEQGEYRVRTDSSGYYDVYNSLYGDYPRFIIKLHNERENVDYFLACLYKETAKGSTAYHTSAWGFFTDLNTAKAMTFDNAPHIERNTYSWLNTLCTSSSFVSSSRMYVALCCFFNSVSGRGVGARHMMIDIAPGFTYVTDNNRHTWEAGTFPTANQSSYGMIRVDSDIWSFPELLTSPQPQHNKGEFKGMPTSNIPLRQFIRGNIDYRHTIDIYDETNYSPRNMFLTNRVGALDYSQVEFGNPSGTIKVKSDINFTHFVSSSFSDDNRPIVYKVDHYETVGAGVIRCAYSVDYIKTFFQYHGITDNNPICMRSTSAVGYEPYISDSASVNGNFERYNYNLSNVINTKYIVATSADTYTLLTSDDMALFQVFVNTNAGNKKIISQLTGVYAVPDGVATTLIGEAVSVIHFEGAESFTPMQTAYALRNQSTSTDDMPYSHISVNLNGNFLDQINNFVDLTGSYTLHVPYYGDLVLTPDELILLNRGQPKLYYYIDYIGGNIAVQIANNDGSYGIIHSYVPMAQKQLTAVDVETVRYVTTSQNTAEKYNIVGNAMQIGGGVAAAIGSAAMGNVLGVAGGVGAAAKGIYNLGVSTSQMREQNANELQHIANSIGVDVIKASGTSSYVSRVVYLTCIKPQLSMDLTDYYDVVGYPIRKAWNTIGAVEGECYWLNWNFALIKDTEEIINGFALASSDGIIYNY